MQRIAAHGERLDHLIGHGVFRLAAGGLVLVELGDALALFAVAKVREQLFVVIIVMLLAALGEGSNQMGFQS